MQNGFDVLPHKLIPIINGAFKLPVQPPAKCFVRHKIIVREDKYWHKVFVVPHWKLIG